MGGDSLHRGRIREQLDRLDDGLHSLPRDEVGDGLVAPADPHRLSFFRGAHNDLQRATDIIRSIVLEYGLGETLGPLTYPRRRSAFLGDGGGYFPDAGCDYSEATAEAVDAEMKRLMSDRMQRVTQLIRDKRALLDRIASQLLEREVLEGAEFQRMVAECTETQNGEKPAAA